MNFNEKNKRRKSIRLPGYDYSQNGYYFVTICCKNHKYLFGEVIDGKMALNDIGKIAKEECIKTSEIRKNIFLDEFVIMPNHMHGVLVIDNGMVGEYCNTPLHPRKFESPKNNLGLLSADINHPSPLVLKNLGFSILLGNEIIMSILFETKHPSVKFANIYNIIR